MGTERDERRVAVIIEDDDDIRHLLETVLGQAGFETIARSNGLEGIEAVRTFDPVVTTLDVNMPGIDGFETAKRIRAFSSTYIVMLTALGEEIDTLQGLEAGADDYVTKPFRPRELRARIEAMLRRPRGGEAEAAPVAAAAPPLPPAEPHPVPIGVVTPVSESVIESEVAIELEAIESDEPAEYVPAGRTTFTRVSAASVAAGAPAPARVAGQDGWVEHNGLWLNSEMRVVEIDGAEVTLTRSEFDLLAGLIQTKRRVRTKSDLALLLRGESYVTSHFVSEADKRGIEVHMGNLRKKLAENPASPRWIETVRGVGYRLTADDD